MLVNKVVILRNVPARMQNGSELLCRVVFSLQREQSRDIHWDGQ
jgi:hypothetical protein